MRVLVDPASFTNLVDYVDSFPTPYTRAELIATWSHHQFRAALASGRVVRVVPSSYCSTRHRRNPSLIAVAVGMWLADAAVTGETALALHEPRWEASGPIVVAVRSGVSVKPQPGVVVVHRGRLPDSLNISGGRVATRAAAVVDAWCVAHPSRRAGLYYRAMWARCAAPHALHQELARRARVPERQRLARLIDESLAGSESWLESFARRQVFHGAAFAAFEFQVVIDTGAGRRRADMCHRRARVVVELDGRHHHESTAGVRSDRERDAELAAAGFVTLRFGFTDLRDRPEHCRRLVLRAVAHRLSPR